MSSEIIKLEKIQLSVNEKNVTDLFSRETSTPKLKIPPKLEFSDNALKVIEKRYLLKDRNRKPTETPAEMLRRIARHIAQADALYDKSNAEIAETEDQFYEIMARLEFLPNSPTFTGAGTKLGQLSACFVLPIEDDMTSILKTQMDMGLIHKSGGGTGFSFSRLRPKNDVVGSTGGISSGPIGFLQMYNDTTECIKQGGTRRGANMGILRVDHPDILEFIDYKEKDGTLSNFNISVAMTKEFMNALEKDKEYDLINPRGNEVTGKLKAREVFDRIVAGAWRNGEPGVIFLDKINEKNQTPKEGEIESTNPCGEQPLLPYESCNLGSINLGKMIKNVDGENEIDWRKLDRAVEIAVHFLDNVIDVNKLPVSEIAEQTKKTRKIGLGVMGFADLLFLLGIPYNSLEGLEIAEKIMKRISEKSHAVSEEFGRVRGNFPAFPDSVWQKQGKKYMRNATTTTVAPTGTLSIIANATSGVEPIFALVYTKTVMDKDELVEVNKYFKEALQKEGIYSDEIINKVAKTGTISDFEEIPEKLKKVFVTAADISPDWHVRMQAAFQKYTDNGISKTINFPNSATEDDVRKAYLLAYKLNCKGITVYRDGSRAYQVLTTGTTEKSKEQGQEIQTVVSSGIKITPRERPDVIHGSTYRIKTAYGKLFVTINDDEKGQPFEIFSHLGKAGGFFAAKAEAICRLISLSLRSGIDPQEIISQLKGIRGPTPTWSEDGKMILSLPDGIAQILEKHLNKNQAKLDLEFETGKQQTLAATEPTVIPIEASDIANGLYQPQRRSMADLGEAPACPECGGMLEFSESCLKCNLCGYSKCS